MTKPPIPTENSKTKGQHTNATKNFDYTMIADGLRDGQLELQMHLLKNESFAWVFLQWSSISPLSHDKPFHKAIS